METRIPELAGLAAHLAKRRTALLDAWRTANTGDPEQPTAGSLTRTQLEDHVPGLLDYWQQKLHRLANGEAVDGLDAGLHREEFQHGVQRWQQGYRLRELLREWRHLHLVLADEIGAYATAQAWPPPAVARAYHELILLIGDGVASSAQQYAELERTEAQGRVKDLDLALAAVRDLEQQRSQLIHQAVHDLRGDVQSVSSVASLLSSERVEDQERIEFGDLLQQGISGVSGTLGDLLELARLEAGRERIALAPFDAARMLTDLCRFATPQAEAKRLYLRHEGPPAMGVTGDANKTRRAVQNLLLNALKYTERGGIVVSWGQEPKHWWVKILDTGPGMLAGPSSPITLGLRDATMDARKIDSKSPESRAHGSPILNQADLGPANTKPPAPHAGEGIGLSITKRLCELLDARLELVSSSEKGTAFRIAFPLEYPPQAAPANPPSQG